MTSTSETEQKKSEQRPLPSNPYELGGFIIRMFGDNAALLLVAAGIAAGFYMFRDQQMKYEAARSSSIADALRVEREAVAADKRATEALRSKAVEQLTSMMTAVTNQSDKTISSVSTMSDLQSKISGIVTKGLDELVDVEQRRISAEKKAKEAESAVRQHASDVALWSNLLRLAVLGGELVTADSQQDAERVFKQIENVEIPENQRSEFMKAIAKIRDDGIVSWVDGPISKRGKLNSAVLELGKLSRNSFRNAPESLKRLIVELEAILYDEAVSITQQLARSADPSDIEQERMLWKLYWGKLVFVESPEVESGMVKFCVRPGWKNVEKTERISLANNLKSACELTLRKRRLAVLASDEESNSPRSPDDQTVTDVK